MNIGKYMVLFFIVLIPVSIAYSPDGEPIGPLVVAAQLREGETRTYNIGGASYDIYFLFAHYGSRIAIFEHNNQRTPELKVNDSFTFSDGLNFRLDILRTTETGGYWDAYFVLSTAPRCGDGICSQNENCKSDKCCNGETKDLNSDTSNCGACGNKCASGTNCVDGVCTIPQPSSYCGNGACDANEDYSSCPADCKPSTVCGDDVCYDDEKDCCQDCGCDLGYDCIGNKCVPIDRCLSDESCKDDDPCTIDKCSGTPKKCVNTLNVSCDEIRIREKQASVPPSVNISLQAENKVNASAASVSAKKPILAKVIGWLKALFRK